MVAFENSKKNSSRWIYWDSQRFQCPRRSGYRPKSSSEVGVGSSGSKVRAQGAEQGLSNKAQAQRGQEKEGEVPRKPALHHHQTSISSRKKN